MEKSSGPVMRLVGSLRTQESDWDLSGYRALFENVGAIAKKGLVTRLVRYSGEAGGRTVLRFFGIAVELIDSIPEGMSALELHQDSFRIFQSMKGKPVVTWQDKLAWRWLDSSVPGAPVGDFTALFPSGRASLTPRQSIEFTITANSYFQRDKPADDAVRLVDYDPSWPNAFRATAAWLKASLPPGFSKRIEHFGSTAIPGMAAKPVIDILLDIPSFEAGRRVLVPLFNKPEIEYWMQENDMVFILRREFTGPRTVHIHAAPPSSVYWEQLAFQEYLKTHPEDAARYAALKKDLAARHAADREEYTNAKAEFIEEITAKARKNSR
jgi:GrpB-like predicted nucleotidyltransferase (UPF0157 family)